MEELRWLAGLVARIQRVSNKGVSGISAEPGTVIVFQPHAHACICAPFSFSSAGSCKQLEAKGINSQTGVRRSGEPVGTLSESRLFVDQTV
jgi:hypothetical protein